MGYRFFICLILFSLSGCSFVVDGAPGPDSEPLDSDTQGYDRGSPDVSFQEDAARVASDGDTELDASTGVDSSSDSSTGDALASLSDVGLQSADSGTDAGVILDASMALADAFTMDAMVSAECLTDVDCGDARRCLEGRCDTLLCDQCEEGRICLQGCCQLPADEQPGQCETPHEMRLGEPAIERLVDEDHWSMSFRPSCQRTNETEFFGVYVPEETDIYCVTSTGTRNDATLFIRLNCCDDPDSELACSTMDGLSDQLRLQRTFFAGVSYHIGLETNRLRFWLDGGRAAPVISRGPCDCNRADDCDVLHVCIDGACVDRRGADCSDGSPCGRRAACVETEDGRRVCADER